MTTSAEPKKYTVLHVDDDPDICEIVRFRLSQQKYDVVTATSAKEALRLVGQQKVSIAILDVGMPSMNGYQLAKELRKMQPRLPIVMLTGIKDDKNISRSLEIGCESLIEKPFTFDVLEFNIQRLLSSPKYRSAA